MSPLGGKNSPANQTLTTTTAQDARLLVRETLRISATLASSPSAPPAEPLLPLDNRNHHQLRLGDDFVGSSFRLICCEEIDGRRWNYVAEPDSSTGTFKKGSFRALSLHSPQPPLEVLKSFVTSYVVPEGFPDSVIPSYVPYMTWRALKHFFGGAMGVFTTQTLLSSVGIARNTSASGAVAINWILKDGAGRVGKMLFARQGKKFDYDLKQLRFAGDLLMELGAGVELATAAVPHLFLPLACAANVAKNVAAVTSTSTRTPIYKAFAKGENIGDVTAKGECVGNIADLLGTGLSILISKRNPSLVTTFALLSCGYVLSSYKEVKSVVLHTLNRARFSMAVDAFLKTGTVPSLQEGNVNENVFSFPWVKDGPVVLGPRFKDAFQEPSVYLALEPFFEKERYVVTYNPSKGKVYALLKDQAKSDDILKAAFHAQVLLHFMRLSYDAQPPSQKQIKDGYSNFVPTAKDLEAYIVESCKMVSHSYGIFKSKAAEQGWMMSEAHLNPGRARLIK
ncbi:putative Root UVB sensitive family [Rosa chinensis]|uniref:Putative Root UVB sensitive family n=1 Tax=Rosa chinensis TaxID=74649 RepID=A0A2P6PCI7_ROSCH|nr:protein root UVB sensitive 6 [Rosa chinensis]PRQ19635.1 putative Root UVB sensitive family [Rosa chinensis]